MLLAVEKDGKWGVMDLGGRFFDKTGRYNFKMPIIPCEYDKIEVIDDFTAICDGKAIDVRDLGYEMD